jgi:hypothetical protein
MTHDVDAIYDQGVFRPLAPLVLPNGTRVHLHVEEESSADTPPSSPPRIRSPQLAHPKQAAGFILEVQEIDDKTAVPENRGVIDWLLACPEKGWFRSLSS